MDVECDDDVAPRADEEPTKETEAAFVTRLNWCRPDEVASVPYPE